MLKTYWKIVFRNFRKYKSYAIINVLGMGIGIAAMVWGYQTYRFSFGFDDFHRDRDNVYRGLTIKKDGEGLRGIFPMAAVRMAKQDFSGIKAVVRYEGSGVNVRHDTSETFAEEVHFTDPAFFELFNFPVIAGTQDIGDPDAVLVTETTAKKYFGSQDPIGKTLTFYAGEEYAKILTVKGVLKDVPLNSTLQFGMITNFDNLLKEGGRKIQPQDWSLFLDAAFFYIPDPANASLVERELKKYLPLQNRAREDSKVSGFKLVTLRQSAEWQEDMISNNALYRRPGDAAAFGPLVLAFLIFLSACLNFSNTTVANAGRRLKEIGMRKVMGSTYRQLMAQLLSECGVIVVASILLSILFNNWWLPVFNSMFEGVDVKADYVHDVRLLVFLGCMLVGTTLLAGTYPAFYVSRFSPTSIFRGTVKFSNSNLFSRLMLGLQLSIAIITVISSIAFARNATFQRNYDYGYHIEGNMGVVLTDSIAYTALKNRLASVPGITALAGASHHIGFAYRNMVAESGGIRKEVNYLEVGRGYTEAMGLKLAAGRGFDAGQESDYQDAILITEKMAAIYGWNSAQALGKRIRLDSVDYMVVGTLKDFHPASLFDLSQPIAMKLVKENKLRFLVVAANAGELTGVFGKVRDVWKSLFPLKPFNGFYQNQLKAKAYQVSRSIATIFEWFGIVSILLTATGLFALVSLTTLNKMKEIALRKVVGAGPRDILLLINKGYFWIFLVAAALGCFAGLAMTRLLLDLIFKINVGVSTTSLVLSVGALFIIAAFTTGIKVWQAIKTNPVKLLRAE